MKIIHYCQHVLGMGHFFRSLEIARGLDREEIIFVAGGERPDQPLPDNVEYRQLPGLCMNEQFGGLMPTDPGRELEEVKKERSATLLKIFAEEKPDVFLIELFPFGRKAFRFELLPVLDAIREGRFGDVKVVCSLRDILVERDDGGKHEARVVKYLNKYFDLLLIHSDPKIAALNETFQAFDKIEIPCEYTGFAARKPAKNVRDAIRTDQRVSKDEKLLIASAGGGKVGGPLMESVLESFISLNAPESKLLMLTGPFLNAEKFDALCATAKTHENITIQRFAADFTDLLTAGDAMISMAGYNTCMDILTSNIPAAVLPFAFNHEQRTRAEKLAKYIPLEILDSNSDMSAIIQSLLKRERTTADHTINLQGAQNSAASIRKLRKI
ncbi:glycosyltransferase family protein [Desulfovibrio sp. JC010]|uniref:glycosyltransferase family protein n=1 Tax=Desulfovibrio sp. JC010 TaxID=2593641 RepID=UPI0013D20069|nr:glycosyltransferase [Desulfovibrio sp. JC010]NDV27291.1 glycosyltransferase family 28 [Desulfovibrio sp. JC010]